MAKLGYIRVSTDKQLVDRQVQLLEDHCDRVYIEHGVSALSKRRPVYEQVMASLKSGDVFIVSSLDRAFRSVKDALNELERLQQLHVQFKSLSQDFDTTTPHGKLLYTLTAALAEWEREILSQRTKEGIQAARKRGKCIGRPRKLDEKDLETAKALIATNSSVLTVARLLNVHEVTLKRALAK